MISKWWRCDPRYQSDEQLEELTGVSRNVFDLLTDLLEPRWLDLQAELLEKKRVQPRVYAKGGGAVGLEFSSRLFVVLVFLRSNQTYRMIQATYEVGKDTIWRSLGDVCTLIPELGVVLSDGMVIGDEDALRALLFEYAAPADDDPDPDGFSGAIIVDGSFTQVGRPRGWEKQKLLYNYHRGRHCLVFQTCVNAYGDLLWLSPSSPGSTHDLTALASCRLGGLITETRVPFMGDKSYQGVQARLGLAKGHQTFVPVKKPKGKELDDQTKFTNRIIASIRVKVEHIHARIKAWKTLVHYRGRRGKYDKFDRILRSVGVISTAKYRLT